MRQLSLEDLLKLMDYEQVINLNEDNKSFATEGEKVFLGRYDQNIIYDENLAY